MVTPRAVLERVLSGPPRPLLELRPGVTPELVAICEKAMARAPDDRYPTMIEMADDLRAYLENRVVRAHRTGALVEFKKWVERNQGMAAGFLAAVVALVAGLVAAVTLGARANEARARADENARVARE